MKPFKIGEYEVSSIIEREGPIRTPKVMFPTADLRRAEELLREGPSNVWSPTSGILFNTYQTFVIRSAKRTVLIDTCVGENKARPPHFNYPKQPWLDGFDRQGLRFEQVDVVVNTHLHVDHCGWNTRLVNGRCDHRRFLLFHYGRSYPRPDREFKRAPTTTFGFSYAKRS